jgi:hypothetical protein
MDDAELEALTAVELAEARLLAWGAVGAEWTEEELLSVLAEHGDAAQLLKRLVNSTVIVRTPSGGYRSRSAETVRLIATLRQSFRNQRVGDGSSLVLDYRFLHRPRRRPARDVSAQDVLTELRDAMGPAGMETARRLMPSTVSGFQRRSIRSIVEALGGTDPTGIMVAAGTGAGKTLAFYLPLLAWLSDRIRSRKQPQTTALALYPRNELLKDQLRTLLGYVMRIHAGNPGNPAVSLGTWFGQTPASAYAISQGWAEGWAERGQDYVCPYLRCLDCDGDLVWRAADIEAKTERLVCVTSSCGAVVDGTYLRLTRDRANENPPDLMLSTTESLNRQLAAPGNLGAFGIRPSTLAAVLLDEVHTYEGTTGAQNAILLRRMRHALGRTPVWVGLSATLSNASEFFARLVGLPSSAVTIVQPRAEELEEAGAEYLLAVRSDPHSRAGTLSTSIQTTMVLARCLDSATDNPLMPAPTSNGVFGSRLFVFTDKLDSTNRLYWSLLDAEGWAWPDRPNDRHRPLTLAHLRSETQQRLRGDLQERAADRDADGQWWWLPELLGQGVAADRQLRLGRTSSQDRGVSAGAQVVVATATLEVGFDDDRVGAVVQHKAPHDAAQFLQRKGRAGRRQGTRPWTVVVLSDWGRDREAWSGYDALFDPDLPPRNLPVENFYVLRIQAVYSLMDWLAGELHYGGSDSVWSDLSGPPAALYPTSTKRQAATQARQDAIAKLLDLLLRPGPQRQRLRRHLLRALGLGHDEVSESIVDSMLWDSPRPLLLAVVPTMRRRLRDQWRGEEPLPGSEEVRTRTPLRSFVPGNLFDELLVPEVELAVPGKRGQTDMEALPALRALREVTPGNVTRHFGVWASNKRHWLPLPLGTDDSQLRVDLVDTYRVQAPVETLDLPAGRVEVYSPVGAVLQPVPPAVRDSSAVQPDWEFYVSALGAGNDIRLDRAAQLLLTTLSAHVHAQGGGVRTIRYARTASGTVWGPQPRVVRLHFGSGGDAWHPAALGVDVHCDALEGTVRLPEPIRPPDPVERSSRLRHHLLVEADLPAELSSFDRESLTEVVQLALVSARLHDEQLTDHAQWSAALAAAAAVLGLAADLDDHQPADRGRHWGEWCQHPAVLTAVVAAVAEISTGERSPAWTAWWRRRYTLSIAELVVSALSSLCVGVDVEELAVDLTGGDGQFWVSEPSPGGTGQIEAFLRVLVQEPEAFSRALEDVLAPTSADTLDEELVLLLRNDSQGMRGALVELRDAWTAGHTAVDAAIRRVDDVARAEGVALGGPARSALSTRLAGPGAHPELLDVVVNWLDLRDRATEAAGVEVDPRTLGALLAHDEHLDEVLHLGDDATAPRRARAVANVLWPWGERAPSFRLYGPPLQSSTEIVRAHVTLGPVVVDAVPWDDDRRTAVHDALREHREIVLRTGHSDHRALRAAMIDLQAYPIEVGPLLCHPVVVGQRTSSRFTECRVLLREAQ